MLRPTLSRFHFAAILALLLGALTLWLHQVFLFAVVIILFLAIVGLGVAFPQLCFFGKFICRGKNSQRCVALTFDDGPDANATPQLLDLLMEEKIAAAFFCVGKKVAANSELSARIVREGHLLQNHSYAHSNLTNFFSIARLRMELTQTQAAIRDTAGIVPQFFRPPMGLSNPRIFRAARSLDLKVIGWTIRSLDTIFTEPEKIVARISKRLESGAIILLHDGDIPAERLVLTVKLLLATLRERGYDVVRLDKMLE
ncbi:MAG TPA: polysaccharide deacetylase family protein [Verrucomicrobiae bacterium]|jgi:peptidoglycan/xylan/chitin deacetylase (PgdA/CDA1 family)|nr:polysaccharide deacetylase family protein [Verrucomicrobiae bacterium]